MQHGKRPVDQRRVDAQMLYGRHVLAVQIAVVIQQLHHVAAQGGGGFVQPSVLQLPGEAGGKGCHGAVPAPGFRDESGWLAASAGIGAVLYPLQQGVFLGGALQKVRQLLGGHQQHPGGLQQLRRYPQCLLRLQPQFQIGHSHHLLPHFPNYMKSRRKRQAAFCGKKWKRRLPTALPVNNPNSATAFARSAAVGTAAVPLRRCRRRRRPAAACPPAGRSPSAATPDPPGGR